MTFEFDGFDATDLFIVHRRNRPLLWRHETLGYVSNLLKALFTSRGIVADREGATICELRVVVNLFQVGELVESDMPHMLVFLTRVLSENSDISVNVEQDKMQSDI